MGGGGTHEGGYHGGCKANMSALKPTGLARTRHGARLTALRTRGCPCAVRAASRPWSRSNGRRKVSTASETECNGACGALRSWQQDRRRDGKRGRGRRVGKPVR